MNVNSKNFKDKDINDKNQQFENPKLNKIFQFVKDKISFEELKLMEEKVGFQQTILNIIKDSDNVSKDFALYLVQEVNAKLFEQFDFLHLDKKAVKIALSNNSDLFKTVANKYKNDPEIGAVVVIAMVRENKSFSEVEYLIEEFFPLNKANLYSIYSEKLLSAQKFENQDFTKIINIIEKEDADFYNLLLSLNIIKTVNNKGVLNDNFITLFIDDLNSNEDYKKLKSDKKYDFKKNYLLEILSIVDTSLLSKEQEFLLKTLLDLITIEENKKKVEVKKVEEKFEKNEEIEIQNESLDENQKEHEYQELIDYVYPNSVVESYPSGYYINTDTGRQIKVTNQEMDKFNTKSLKSFIEFYNILYDLGLNFFWDEYKTDFISLCKQKTGSFDYMNYGGISDSKILSVLNIIGRNVGISEEETMGDDMDPTGDYVCFKTLADAKKEFAKIYSSGEISGQVYSDNPLYGDSAVKNKLIEDGLLDDRKFTLNTTLFK